ncbi:MAG: site-2 protease family protein [Acidobacteriota bacterium]|jgi:Zn-dependent protease
MSVEWGSFALWYVVFLFSLTIHEGAHALAAHLGGDDTAYHGGQVSLNPLPHIRQEPFGTLLLPVLSYLAFGWVMGWASTPIDALWARRHPRRAALMSLAGPAANLLLAIGAFAIARTLLAGGVLAAPDRADFDQVVRAAGSSPSGAAVALAAVLSMALVLNTLLAAFNLIPVPPLDGSGVLEGLLPERAADRFRDWVAAPGTRWIGLLVVWFGFGRLVGPLFRQILRVLHPGVAYG